MTTERQKRFQKVIAARQPDLTVVLEDITDPHNIAAVLRSCDAVGISEVFVIQTYKPYGRHTGKDVFKSKASSSARKWIKIHKFQDRSKCVEAIRQKYDRLLATHLDSEAVDLYSLDLNLSTALVFGNEHSGVSEELLKLCDGNFVIPQMGMIQSLNISVACAVSLYEALRQRKEADAYSGSRMDKASQEILYSAWAKRELERKNQ